MASSAVRLFLLAFVASVAITFVATMPQTMTLENGGALDVLLFGLTILALSFLAPALASEVMQGNPSLSAAQPIQGGMAGCRHGRGRRGHDQDSHVGRRTRRAARARGGIASSGFSADAAAHGAQPNYGAMQPKTSTQTLTEQ